MKRTALLSLVIGIMLILGTGGVLTAQTSANQEVSGYFVNVGSQPTGPYDTNGLRQLINQGQLARNTLVWKEGMPQWAVAGTIDELAFLFASSTPPPLPPSQGPPPVPAQTPPPIAQAPQAQAPQAQQPAPAISYNDNYQDFNAGHRWAAFWINWLVPGVGSFAIMRDGVGGGVNLGLGLAAIITTSVGVPMALRGELPGYILLGTGGCFQIATLIHNIVRTATYHRPRPRMGLADLNNWDLAIVPGNGGIEAVSLSYKLSF